MNMPSMPSPFRETRAKYNKWGRRKKFAVISLLIVLLIGAGRAAFLFAQDIGVISGNATITPITGSSTLGPFNVNSCNPCSPVVVAGAFTLNNITGNSASYIETDTPSWNHTLTITVQPHGNSCPATPTGYTITSSPTLAPFGSTGVKDYCLYFDSIPAGENINLHISWTHQ